MTLKLSTAPLMTTRKASPLTTAISTPDESPETTSTPVNSLVLNIAPGASVGASAQRKITTKNEILMQMSSQSSPDVIVESSADDSPIHDVDTPGDSNISLKDVADVLTRPIKLAEEKRANDNKQCSVYIESQLGNIANLKSMISRLEHDLQLETEEVKKIKAVFHPVLAVVSLMVQVPSSESDYQGYRLVLDSIPINGQYKMLINNDKIGECIIEHHKRNTGISLPDQDYRKEIDNYKFIGTIVSCNGPWVLTHRIRCTRADHSSRVVFEHSAISDLKFKGTFTGALRWDGK